MKTLKAFEFPEDAGRSSYDWDALLSGKIPQLEEGTDFRCKAATFATLARSQAKKRGMGVRISKVEGGLVIRSRPVRVNHPVEWPVAAVVGFRVQSATWN